MKQSAGKILFKELDGIKAIAITYNDLIEKSDAVVCLEGDSYNRLNQAVKILKQRLAKNIVISGGRNNPPFSIPASILTKELLKKKIPQNKIITEEKSQNTYEQGIEVMKIAKKRKWKRIILIASHFHQPRAYLTFLRTMRDLKLKIQIFNAPVRELSWFNKTSLKLSRLQLLEEEFKKIKEYAKKGHIATSKEAIKYQEWKEKQK